MQDVKIGHKSCFEKFQLFLCSKHLLAALYCNLNPLDVTSSLDLKLKKSWLLEEIWRGGGGEKSQYPPIIGDVFEPPSYMYNLSTLKQ